MIYTLKSSRFFVSLFLLLCIRMSVSATTVDSVGVSNSASSSMILHKVELNENWYSISRRFSVNYTELRLANKQSAEILKVGQVINIPPKPKSNDPRFQKNFIDKQSVAVPAANAEKIVPEPTPVKTESSKKDATAPTTQAIPTTAIQKSSTDVSVGDTNPSMVKHKVIPGQTVFSISKIYGVTPSAIASWNKLKNYTIEVGQELVIKNPKGNFLPVDYTSTKSSPKPEVSKPVAQPEVVEEAPINTPAPEVKIVKKPSSNSKTINGYIFSNNRSDVSESGVASWIEDEDINPNKYYALHRTAPIGTIIKVKNKMNDRSLFVKVVGQLPDTGDNAGLIIKISEAAANQLDVFDKRFQVELFYGVSSMAQEKN